MQCAQGCSARRSALLCLLRVRASPSSPPKSNRHLDWGLLGSEGRPGPVPCARARSIAPVAARSAAEGGLWKAWWSSPLGLSLALPLEPARARCSCRPPTGAARHTLSAQLPVTVCVTGAAARAGARKVLLQGPHQCCAAQTLGMAACHCVRGSCAVCWRDCDKRCRLLACARCSCRSSLSAWGARVWGAARAAQSPRAA